LEGPICFIEPFSFWRLENFFLLHLDSGFLYLLGLAFLQGILGEPVNFLYSSGISIFEGRSILDKRRGKSLIIIGWFSTLALISWSLDCFE